jgi:hypothetical protein
LIVSLPLVPLTTTLSAWPSPVAPPRVPARSTFTLLTSVPLRSSTVTRSAPPRALKSTRSTPAVSIVTLPGSRKNSSRFPLADSSTCSDTAAPLNTIVSVPSWPSIVSLPSPGSQTKVSSPAPSRARSLPPFPSIESFPLPPSSVSTPLPPAIVSFPSPPSIVVGIVSVKAPLLSSMRTRSSPARASTAIFAILLRSKLKSAEPSSLTSTWRIPGRPACRRSAILSLASVPSIVSTPCLSFGCLNLSILCAADALATGAACPCPATIPKTPATATTTATAEAASHTGRAVRDSLSRTRLFMSSFRSS